MKFRIDKYRDTIIVFENDKKIMSVNEGYRSWHPTLFEFFIGNVSVLTATYNNTIFSTELKIVEQNLPFKIESSDSILGLKNNGNIYSVKKRRLSKTIYYLCENENVIGDIKLKQMIQIGEPIIYFVNIESESSNTNTILLILLAILIPSLQGSD